MPRKVKASTDNSGWVEPKKVRKRRKPMTEEQKRAASERLEKARAARAASRSATLVQADQDFVVAV